MNSEFKNRHQPETRLQDELRSSLRNLIRALVREHNQVRASETQTSFIGEKKHD